MKQFLFSLFVFLPSFIYAQEVVEDLSRKDPQVFGQEGRLVSIRVVVGEPTRIFVLGKEEAKLDLDNLELRVRRLQPYPAKVLQTSRSGDFFVLDEPLDLNKPTALEVTTKLKAKKETVRIKIDNKLR